MDQELLKLTSDFSDNFNYVNTITNALICIVLSIVLKYTYLNLSKSWSNKYQFSNLLPILSLTVFLVISIVKSSLALSLGLVGALSIVRFRTPIKEPEELIYLFVSIALGLGLGANQSLLTVIIFIFIIILIFFISKNKLSKENDYNLIIEYKEKDNAVEDIKNIINNNFSIADFVKYESLEDSNELVIFRVSMQNLNELENFKKDLKKLLINYKLSYFENNVLI
jgi:ABC-type multidrug transport system fused ATPase/permease subunit